MSRRRKNTNQRAAPSNPPENRGMGLRHYAILAVVGIGLGVGIGWYLRKGGGYSPPGGNSAISQFKRESDSQVYAQYAGSQSCRECHQAAFTLWKDSHHALAERPVDASLDRAAFDPPRTIKHGTQTSEARAKGNQLELVTLGADPKPKPYSADRIIGVDPLRQLLVPSAGGRLQVPELAYDPQRKDWFDIFGDEDRHPGEWGHWTGRGMTWNNMCAACHNTRVRKNYRADTDVYETKMAQGNVSCEACHGPMAGHVAWQRKNPNATVKDPTPRHFDKAQIMAACGSCHARRAELTGDFQPGDNFYDHFSLTIPDDTDVYYPDGQVRDEDYEFTSFLSSRMSAAGVWCMDCHQPHSSKTLVSDNNLCLRCHGLPIPPAPKIDPAAHSHHLPGMPGGRCVDCHMPQTTYMQRHARRDHGFTIPDPLLTKQHAIPNACNRCHTDRTVDWTLEAVEKWYGPRMNRPSRTRAQSIAQARAGLPTSQAYLLRMLTDEKVPLWRGVAASLLKRSNHEPIVNSALLKTINDSDPLVRTMVVRALEGSEQSNPSVEPMLRKSLDDPIRSVRVEAAWALRARLDTNSLAGHDLLTYLDHNRDQPSGLFQLGSWYSDRGDTAAAVASFRRAIDWDKGSPMLRHGLAVALSLQGKPQEAVVELQAAVRLAPRDAGYHYELGLSLNEAGRLAEATTELEEATKLDPQYSQAWYNLGLAYNANQLSDRALTALAQAETLNPDYAQIPYARATILYKLGRLQEATTAAARALQIQPNHAEAANLLQAISQSRPK